MVLEKHRILLFICNIISHYWYADSLQLTQNKTSALERKVLVQPSKWQINIINKIFDLISPFAVFI